MFETAKKAGVRPHDLAAVVGVSRVTASMWLNGHTGPHHLLADKVAKVLDAINLAVEAGKLPVPSDLKRDERSAYTKRVIEDQLEAQANT